MQVKAQSSHDRYIQLTLNIGTYIIMTWLHTNTFLHKSTYTSKQKHLIHL